MSALPIYAILPELKRQLGAHTKVLLSAAPGAGKTTTVPLALLAEPWLTGKILMLEPRRIAARNAAHFMAKQLGEEVGQTVGYRIRLESKVSNTTHIEVVTEGILTRMLQSDNSLSAYSLIIFDEFHERNLHSDLGLALALSCQNLLRDDLKILIMSATLNGQQLSKALSAPLLECAGQSHALTVHYRPQPLHNSDLISHCEKIIREALSYPGDILVFLPGRKEIERLAEKLVDLSDCGVFPLHGQLNDSAQKAALNPQEKRKIVLATNLAESSVTIAGVRLVIDSGLERRNEFHLSSGLNELNTVFIAKASSIQRAGRAARQDDGQCFRLYSESQFERFDDAIVPEILHSDLTPLQLELYHWGALASELFWLNPPPQAALNQATELLQKLGFLNSEKTALSALGKTASTLNTEPRMAQALLRLHALGQGQTAAEVVALLQERPKKSSSDDFLRLWQQAKADLSFWQKTIQPLAQSILKSLPYSAKTSPLTLRESDVIALCIALIYPDRIGQRRKNSDGFYLSNGRGAKLAHNSDLIHETYLAAADISVNKEAYLRLACPFSEGLWEVLEKISPELFSTETQIGFQENGQYLAFSHKKLGTLTLESQKLPSLTAEQWQSAWHSYILERGLSLFTWDEDALQFKQRLDYAHHHLGQSWPCVDDAALLRNLDRWLLPLLHEARHGKDLAKIPMRHALENLLDWPQKKRIRAPATHAHTSTKRLNGDDRLPTKPTRVGG